MVQAECVAKRWGNSIGVVVPKKIVEEEHITENEHIIIDIRKAHRAKEFFGIIPWKRSAQAIKDEMRKGWQ